MYVVWKDNYTNVKYKGCHLIKVQTIPLWTFILNFPKHYHYYECDQRVTAVRFQNDRITLFLFQSGDKGPALRWVSSCTHFNNQHLSKVIFFTLLVNISPSVSDGLFVFFHNKNQISKVSLSPIKSCPMILINFYHGAHGLIGGRNGCECSLLGRDICKWKCQVCRIWSTCSTVWHILTVYFVHTLHGLLEHNNNRCFTLFMDSDLKTI